jgi:hypothetical protein
VCGGTLCSGSDPVFGLRDVQQAQKSPNEQAVENREAEQAVQANSGGTLLPFVRSFSKLNGSGPRIVRCTGPLNGPTSAPFRSSSAQNRKPDLTAWTRREFQRGRVPSGW